METFIKRYFSIIAIPIFLFGSLLFLGSSLLLNDPLDDALQIKLEEKLNNKAFINAIGIKLYATVKIKSFYQSVQYKSCWLNRQTQEFNIGILSLFLNDAEKEGLVIRDFHREDIKRLESKMKSWIDAKQADSIAEFEILLTDACLAYAMDISTGQLYGDDGLNVNREENLKVIPYNALLKNALDAAELHVWLLKLSPANCKYAQLKHALGVYKQLYISGSFIKLGDEIMKLKPGDTGIQVARLNQFLEQSKGLSQTYCPLVYTYDTKLTLAIRQYQKRTGLHETGIIDEATLKAIQVPVENRITSMIASMERLRWLPEDLGQKYIMVNIPDFSLQVFENFSTQMKMDIIVGKPYKQTPVFHAHMKNVVINPTWDIPHSIIAEEIIPAMAKDPSYLSRHHMKVYTQSDIHLNAGRIRWAHIDPDKFNYKIKQDPGPWNSLGRIKFLFPNPYNVYMHGTPEQRLFSKDVRAYSHGCMRVEDPMALALYLLKDNDGWGKKQIQKQIDKNKELILVLKKYVPVHITYLTAWIDGDDQLHFKDDIYGRDELFKPYIKLDKPSLNL